MTATVVDTDIDLDVSGKGTLMVAGQHAAVLTSITLVERDKFAPPGTPPTGEKELQVEWVFVALKPADPNAPEQITHWTYTTGKKLRELLTQIFGRPLTEEEARQISTAKMIGQIKGYVTVSDYTRSNGQPGVKFADYTHPKNRPYPNVAHFFRNTPAPPQANDDEFDDPFDDT